MVLIMTYKPDIPIFDNEVVSLNSVNDSDTHEYVNRSPKQMMEISHIKVKKKISKKALSEL